MKHLTFVAVGAMMLLASCHSRQASQYDINGTTDAADGELVILGYNNDGAMQMDSAKVTNGKFAFSGTIDQPQIATILMGDSQDWQNTRIRRFIIEPVEMTIALDGGDYTNAPIVGSPSTAVFDKALRDADQYNDQIMSIYQQIRTQDLDEATQEELSNKIDSLKGLSNEAILSNVKANPDSYAGPILMSILSDDATSLDEKGQIYNSWSPEVQATAQDFKQDMDALKAIQPGQPAPDLSGVTPDGQEVKLSDYRGHYVLLDFWATWCGPCRRSMPHVVRLYNEYKDKGLVVFTVSIDVMRDEEKWKEAIQTDNMEGFVNIMSGLEMNRDAEGNPTGYNKENDQSGLYAIKYIPSKFLIDPQGNIIGRFDDESALDAKLAEIYGK